MTMWETLTAVVLWLNVKQIHIASSSCRNIILPHVLITIMVMKAVSFVVAGIHGQSTKELVLSQEILVRRMDQ